MTLWITMVMGLTSLVSSLDRVNGESLLRV